MSPRPIAIAGTTAERIDGVSQNCRPLRHAQYAEPPASLPDLNALRGRPVPRQADRRVDSTIS